jgi:ABC-type microcin C transport system permease subunit YejB
MAAILAAFLIWLFATGKYSDWAALIGVNSGGATGEF